MCSVKGRIKIAVLVSFALVVILGLCFAQTGFTWGETSAARAAVLAFLKQVPPPQPIPEPQVTGREATPEEAAALDQTVNAYLEAVRARKYAAAWELMTDGASMGDQEQPVDGFKLREKKEMYWGREGGPLFMSGRKNRLVDLAIYDNEALAHVAIDMSQPLWLALVKREGSWRIDPRLSDEATARQDVARQLDEMHLDTTDNILRQMLKQEAEGGDEIDYLTLLILSPTTASHKVISRTVDADHAVVKLQTQGELHALIPLTHDPKGWMLDFDDKIQLVAPDFRLSDYKPSEYYTRMTCIRNLKQLALGMLAYCQDYDEKMPPADKWSSGIWPYVKNQQIFNCPAAEKYGYAMNYKLSRAELGQLQQPANTIMLFDSILLRPNAYDVATMPGVSLPEPPRHDGFNNIAYVDGHVRSVDWRPHLGYFRLDGPPPPPPPPSVPAGGPAGPPGG